MMMRFTDNPFSNNVDLNSILYRMVFCELFADDPLEGAEELDANEIVFGDEEDFEAKLTWSHGVECWRYCSLELTHSKDQLKQETERSGSAAESTMEVYREWERKLDLCISLKNELESTAEDLRKNKPTDYLVLAEKSLQSGSKIYFRKCSVGNWAYNNHGIEIPEWLTKEKMAIESNPKSLAKEEVRGAEEAGDHSTRWESVTIRLQAGNKIKFTVSGGKSRTRDLEGTELCDKRKKKLRRSGLLLSGLAEQASIPPGKNRNERNSRSKAVSILRSSLNKLSSLSGDPFYDHNPSDGWKPRFKVLDRRNAASERAEEKAEHQLYDEHQATDTHGRRVDRPYDPKEYPYGNDVLDDDGPEGNAASKFLEENDQ